MNRLASMLLIAAGLLTFLTACDPDSSRLAIREAAQARTAIAPACPTPTDRGKQTAIADEISGAIKAGVPIDTLATEWERLDGGARKCRGAR